VDATAIRNTVLDVIASIAPGFDAQTIRTDRPLRQQIELDSMDWLNVVAGIGERFAVEIPEQDAARLETLDALTAWLLARTSAGDSVAPAPLPTRQQRINGIEVCLRPMQAADLQREADFVRRLSAQSRYDRFMVTLSELPAAKLKSLTDVDQVRHVALVATVQRDGRESIVGVARYIVDDNGTGCEFAIAIDDGWHGTGLAGILMQALIDVARSRRIRSMEGYVLAANTPMLHFAHQLGFEARRSAEDRDTVHVVRAL
jgi:acetyltransferase